MSSVICLPIHLVIAVGHGVTDDREVCGKQFKGLEIVKGGKQLSFSEVAGGTENHNGAGVAGTFVAGQGLFGHCGCN